MIVALIFTIVAVSAVMAHAMHEDMADARANGREVLSLREALRKR